jgi:two-component system CheB/CheR fusion protein
MHKPCTAPAQPVCRIERRIRERVARMQRLTPNCVYVIPPDRELVITDDDVTARPFSKPRGERAPIDQFFRSVALARGDGFAVILSGAGSDGALRVRAIKEAGGVIFVQEPATAEYPMMRRSALAAGVADFVAPIPRLVERMVEVTRSKKAIAALDGDGVDRVLQRIMSFLRSRTGHDSRATSGRR